MKAFRAAKSKIINKVNYKKFTDLVLDIIKNYKGKILALVCNIKILLGTNNFHRFEIIELPSFEDGNKCWSSKEYQTDSSFRKNETGIVDLILVESGDATK